ncbi:transcriptional regulator FtsR [Nonomuraea gerenzanensis]|uniref:Transcriptional regulator, MerR family n=1 Tax=Nonomuraea gerenzanensis TaxID=93944 RepID=A0A1M4E9C0_9ACTN|nr:MerR family transcriptional regulator [Nonomuraea gerenzanensis]UBU17750.1 MerR family transcriptional regulator [Nonomuraea gerenzanensis]SBO95527.1 transcriptional regulator, MerR family [Nonomuraea gerenzanensis]
MTSQAARSHMSIGEVLALLQGEFPDVTISKIRFLEGEGLIEPERSPSGYRKFTHLHVEQLRFILTEQRDHYLPLRVIKDRMAESFGRPRALQQPQETRLSRAELLEAAAIDEETLAELEDYGLLAPVARRYDEEALKVARTVGALARFGLHARHLRAVKAAAEREAGLVEQTVAPILKRRRPGAIGEADEVARELSTLLLDLHASLVRTGVRSVLGR